MFRKKTHEHPLLYSSDSPTLRERQRDLRVVLQLRRVQYGIVLGLAVTIIAILLLPMIPAMAVGTLGLGGMRDSIDGAVAKHRLQLHEEAHAERLRKQRENGSSE